MYAAAPSPHSHAALCASAPLREVESAGVRLVPVPLEDDVLEVIADYGRVHGRTVPEMLREVVLEKFCPVRTELGNAA